MLEVGELGVRFCGRGFAEVEDFGAEFGAGGAEEVGFLGRDVRGRWRGGVGRGLEVVRVGDEGGGLRSRRLTSRPRHRSPCLNWWLVSLAQLS